MPERREVTLTEDRKIVTKDGMKVIEEIRTRTITQKQIEAQIAACDAEIARATERYITPVQARKAALETELSSLRK